MADTLAPHPMQPAIDAVTRAGLQAYVPTNDRMWSYLFFTDGERIGYLERSRFGGLTLSTVHIPNRSSGAGFGIVDHDEALPLDGLTRDALEVAFAHYPSWASQTDRNSVVKYRDVAAFLASRGNIVPLSLAPGREA